MDACFMSMFEVAYEIRDVCRRAHRRRRSRAGVRVALRRGFWPEPRLSRLRPTRRMATLDLAEMIVNEYVEHYATTIDRPGRSADLAAIDLSRIERAWQSVDTRAALTELTSDRRTAITSRWLTTMRRPTSRDQFVDLHDFCIQVYKRFPTRFHLVSLACRKCRARARRQETRSSRRVRAPGAHTHHRRE